MILPKDCKTIKELSREITAYNGYEHLEEQFLLRLERIHPNLYNRVMAFLTDKSEVYHMLRVDPDYFFSLFDLGIQAENSQKGSLSQLLSLLTNQRLYHRSEGFYLGKEETYSFLEKLVGFPNDKRKLSYHIRRIWNTLDDELEEDMDIVTGFVAALMNYYPYLTKEHFQMLPSDWFKKYAGWFFCVEEADEKKLFGYPTLEGERFSQEIYLADNLVSQFEEPVQNLLRLTPKKKLF